MRDQLVIKLDPSTGRPARRSTPGAPTRRARRPITLDMEFADEGGEAPTPYEVLLHAAMIGDSSRFKSQDIVEENWRIMQPLLDDPPAVHPYAPGSWGPARGRRAWWPAPAAGTAPGSEPEPQRGRGAGAVSEAVSCAAGRGVASRCRNTT